MKRPCLEPGCPNTTERSRCKVHQLGDQRTTPQKGLGYDHQQMAKRVLVEEKLCWLCGRPALLGDPLTADHVVPRSRGGTNARSNYRAAHASCNSRRGNRIVPGSGIEPA